MKSILITTFAALLISASAFATNENKVSINIRENFKAEFKGATKVDWTVKSDYVKATFEEKGAQVEVFYDKQGAKIGTSHTVTVEDLPLSARKNIAKNYSDHKITEAVEFSGVDGDAYYVTAENAKEKLILKIVDISSISTFKKTKKEKL